MGKYPWGPLQMATRSESSRKRCRGNQRYRHCFAFRGQATLSLRKKSQNLKTAPKGSEGSPLPESLQSRLSSAFASPSAVPATSPAASAAPAREPQSVGGSSRAHSVLTRTSPSTLPAANGPRASPMTRRGKSEPLLTWPCSRARRRSKRFFLGPCGARPIQAGHEQQAR